MVKIISKDPPSTDLSPNLVDYESCYRDFSWREAEGFLTGTIDSEVNICHEAVDRHLTTSLSDKTAIRWISKSDQIRNISYSELSLQTGRFASVLRSLGVDPGARVYSLLGRVPELYITALGSLKAGCVFTPLFSAFGPQPIRSRMEIGEANVLVTTQKLYQKKVSEWCEQLPHLKHILLVDETADSDLHCLSFSGLMGQADPGFSCFHTQKEDSALLHFTSGTTGAPKGVVHVHGAVLGHIVSAYYALDLHQSDIYWCTADPGWVTGTSYGIIAPLCHGVTMIVDEADFDARRWYKILEQENVTVWYTAPTAIRFMMKLGLCLGESYDWKSLRFVASVGEPLNPEAVLWGVKNFGIVFHDNWWQTETGAIMIANFSSMDVKPGSMGRPLPGITATIVTRDDSGCLIEQNEAMQVGELAVATGWPSMFRAYLNQEDRYKKCFESGWYLTGDLAMRDSDGYYWFVGRADDLIKTSGHLIGPFEVESVLMEHEAVAEAAVIGKPDLVAGELVKAFVSLKAGFGPDDKIIKQILGHARKRLGTAVAPKEIEISSNLPKTRSGKIMRRLLKARELGLPEGDLSTLENNNEQ